MDVPFYLYFVGVILLLLGSLLAVTGWWRYVLTGYLIAQVDPYEQAGQGEGSILFIGDSTGYGTGAQRSSESIAGRLGQAYPGYAIINNSVNGRKVAAAKQVAAELPGTTVYDLIVLQIGANDLIADRDPLEVSQDLQQLIELTLPHAKRVVVITSGNIGASPKFSGDRASQLETASRSFDSYMTAVATEYENASFVSLFDEPAEDPFVLEPTVYMSIDGLHPTGAGYEIWFQEAKPYFDVLQSD